MDGAADKNADDRPANGPGVKLFGRRYPLPRSVLIRRAAGVVLILGGFLGFLPVLGFWMIPLGLLVLSHDSHFVRRWRRRAEVKMGRRRNDGNGTGKNGGGGDGAAASAVNEAGSGS